jgi:hypothetical protein
MVRVSRVHFSVLIKLHLVLNLLRYKEPICIFNRHKSSIQMDLCPW